jgi:hypothetical protein
LFVPKSVTTLRSYTRSQLGAAEQFKDTLGQVAKKPKVLMRDVPAIDSTGLHALHELARSCKHDGTLLLLADVHAQPMFALVRSDMLVELREENLFGNIDNALDRARTSGAALSTSSRWSNSNGGARDTRRTAENRLALRVIRNGAQPMLPFTVIPTGERNA